MVEEISCKHKCTTYWAERAMDPLKGYEGIIVENGVGYAHGSVVCVGNFEKVNQKREEDYYKESLLDTNKLPIWC